VTFTLGLPLPRSNNGSNPTAYSRRVRSTLRSESSRRCKPSLHSAKTAAEMDRLQETEQLQPAPPEDHDRLVPSPHESEGTVPSS
jgi:hypothetical protein